MQTRYQITRSAELASLPVFRDFIENTCQHRWGVEEEACYDLKLAVDEACTNIITHGYAGMNPGSIILRLETEPNRVVATITDFGHPFEPAVAEAPDVAAELEEESMGGFGLFFIYQTMDDIDYQATEDGNQLTFFKKIQSTSDAPTNGPARAT